MPIYEFRCSECEKKFELIRRVSDTTEVSCPVCAGAVTKLNSLPSFHLKGGGWYKDGYSGEQPNKQKQISGSNSSTNSAQSADKNTKTEANLKKKSPANKSTS